MGFVRVASLGQVEEGELLAVKVDGKPLCLARLGGEVYAFTNNCTHRDFPLSDGELDPETCSVTCEWHGARFSVISGEVLALPATQPIRVYSCRVEGEEILVDLG
jgi:3-phenylpropionate/trans-cinnamate dioxygenase ferredoxin component